MSNYKPEYFTNRELSWMRFNERVLEEAMDKNNPLFERLKFLAITGSNLDEFIMVRVSSIVDQLQGGFNEADFSGLTPSEAYEELMKQIHQFMQKQYIIWDENLRLELEKEGVVFVKHHEELTPSERAFVNEYFHKEVYPCLTPMAVDSSRPFPLVLSGSINIGGLVKKVEDNDVEFVTVQLPSMLPRLILLPETAGETRRVILLEEIIEMNFPMLFERYSILCVHPYRITRNGDLDIDEDDASDLLKEVERQVRRRKWGEVTRLEVERKMDARLLEFLKDKFQCNDLNTFEIGGAIDITFLNSIYKLEGFDRLKDRPFIPQMNSRFVPGADIFDLIRKKDILLSHPYESFDPVISFIENSAKDPNVLAIKQTLYRVSGRSPIVASLEKAALNGKQVTVLVELKARFDEEHNIAWARRLEQAGAHVIYGLKGLKTHSKITLVVRRDEDGIRRYVHLGTGNYNDSTARLYTDLGLFTCDINIGEDATALFNMMSGYSEPANWNSLIIAPLWLRKKMLVFIQRETQNALEGQKAKITMKMNSLCDREMIEALYDASKAGVKIKLLVRGICSLRAGIPGISDNIKVYSIVGRYLEHSRIYYFYNSGKEDVYLSSADLMPRNLSRRVEIMFPIYDKIIKEEVMHHLDILLKDNIKKRQMMPDGTYKYARDGKEQISAHEYFMNEAVKRAPKSKKVTKSGAFIPMTSR